MPPQLVPAKSQTPGTSANQWVPKPGLQNQEKTQTTIAEATTTGKVPPPCPGNIPGFAIPVLEPEKHYKTSYFCKGSKTRVVTGANGGTISRIVALEHRGGDRHRKIAPALPPEQPRFCNPGFGTLKCSRILLVCKTPDSQRNVNLLWAVANKFCDALPNPSSQLEQPNKGPPQEQLVTQGQSFLSTKSPPNTSSPRIEISDPPICVIQFS